MKTLINQQRSIAHEVKDVEQCIFLLSSLPDSWDNLIVAINGSTRVENFNTDEFVGQLLQEETRRRNCQPAINSEGLVAREHNKDKTYISARESLNLSGRYAGKVRKQELICWKCRQKGHKKVNAKHISPRRRKTLRQLHLLVKEV
ncbi:hypothetical protein SUGI_0061780 [Cryptomeria japonica]|nr:hypothetical protein SUGI_0061780 [Cryptomeria japonica]